MSRRAVMAFAAALLAPSTLTAQPLTLPGTGPLPYVTARAGAPEACAATISATLAAPGLTIESAQVALLKTGCVLLLPVPTEEIDIATGKLAKEAGTSGGRTLWLPTPAVRGLAIDLYNAHQEAMTFNRGAFAVRTATPDEAAATRASSAPSAAPSGTWSGAGSKTTDAFTASGPWRVRWSARPTRDSGSMMVVVRKSNGDIVTSIDSGRLSASRSDVSTVHESGTFYLEINGFSTEWAVSIER